MNDMKKIPMLEKFAAQSLIEHDGELVFSKEKFAELIVRECLDQLHVSDWDEDYDKGIYWSREQIKNHFGVEE